MRLYNLCHASASTAQRTAIPSSVQVLHDALHVGAHHQCFDVGEMHDDVLHLTELLIAKLEALSNQFSDLVPC